jgi:hypothetical protein
MPLYCFVLINCKIHDNLEAGVAIVTTVISTIHVIIHDKKEK